MRALTDILQLRQGAEHAAQDLPALSMQARRAAQAVLHGFHAQRKPGMGEEFWQFREYRPGDRPQDIDWRQSAKTRDVYIRQKEWHTTQSCFFWCAGGAGMDWASARRLMKKGDAARILALALAILMQANEERVGLLGTGETGRSGQMLDKIGQGFLDYAKDGRALPPSMHLHLPRHSSLVLAGDFLSPLIDIQDVFTNLSTRTDNVLILQVLDPAEIDLPYAGRVAFFGAGTGEKEIVEDAASVRMAYNTRIEAHIGEIQALCSKLGWSYVLHQTDRPLEASLLDVRGLFEPEKGSGPR
ncbi:MAG: DUF58 domain-containing protein [Alphaproteobacteria bacterium]|nr:DUF58 domain-containing protein [Alphaproteobacteria bacterium]